MLLCVTRYVWLAFRSSLFQLFSMSARSAWRSSSLMPCRAITTQSTFGSSCCLSRNDSRMIRRMRLLCTAFRAFFLEITKPSLGWPIVLVRARINREGSKTLRLAPSNTHLNSTGFNKRKARGYSKLAIKSLLYRYNNAVELSWQSFATFRTATINDLATVFGGHTCAKTVSASALQYAGLKCSFHG